MAAGSLAGRFKIGTRIYSGFAVVLALLCVVAILAVLNLRGGTVRLDDYAKVAASTVGVTEIVTNVADMRLKMRVFLDNNDAKALVDAKARRDEIMADLKRLDDEIEAPGVRQNLARMKELATIYGTNMDKAEGLVAEKEKLFFTDLVGIGTKVITGLADVVRQANADGEFEAASRAGLAQNAYTLGRYWVARFIDRADQKFADSANENFDLSRKLMAETLPLAKSPKTREVLAETIQLAPRYQEILVLAQRKTMELQDHVEKGLSLQAAEFADVAETANVEQTKYLESVLAEADEASSRAEGLVKVLSIGALALGVFFAWMVARSIAVPVREMTDTMTGLAHGNLDLTIPALANKDEIGEMAKAVEVFKDNAIEKKRMDEAEKARLEEERRQEEAQRKREAAMGQEIATLIEAVSKGDLSRRLDLSDKEGFYRSLSEGINRLTDTVADVIADLGVVLGALAEGDLTKRVAKDYQGAFERLKNDVNATASKLAEIVGNIRGSAEAIAAAAGEVSAGSSDLADRTEQQASSLEE
ncbi:MAG TPA: HAMP domain-containing protein, partial [Azospirillaceae bacterium]|nr:HAMP domain-containing protein [Azospirillaceae bacterium]